MKAMEAVTYLVTNKRLKIRLGNRTLKRYWTGTKFRTEVICNDNRNDQDVVIYTRGKFMKLALEHMEWHEIMM